MNDKFDEITKSMAQSVTRWGALKKFGVGLVGMALACFGLANKAEADPKPPSPCLPYGSACQANRDCCSGNCVIVNGHFYPVLVKKVYRWPGVVGESGTTNSMNSRKA